MTILTKVVDGFVHQLLLIDGIQLIDAATQADRLVAECWPMLFLRVFQLNGTLAVSISAG